MLCLNCSQELLKFLYTAIFLPEDYDLYSGGDFEVIAFTPLMAKSHLLLNWKSTTAPSSTQWIREKMSVLKVKQDRHSTRGNLSMSHHKYQPILDFYTTMIILLEYF